MKMEMPCFTCDCLKTSLATESKFPRSLMDATYSDTALITTSHGGRTNWWALTWTKGRNEKNGLNWCSRMLKSVSLITEDWKYLMKTCEMTDCISTLREARGCSGPRRLQWKAAKSSSGRMWLPVFFEDPHLELNNVIKKIKSHARSQKNPVFFTKKSSKDWQVLGLEAKLASRFW